LLVLASQSPLRHWGALSFGDAWHISATQLRTQRFWVLRYL
jgi:hypothetical protein